MKTLKIQIFENGKRIDKAVYHGYTLAECIKNSSRITRKRCVDVWYEKT